MDKKQHAKQVRREIFALCVALATVTTVTLSMWSCGDDLTFPGNIPPTMTASMTPTAVPTQTFTPIGG